MAETSGLLNRRTGDSRTEGSNPSVSASTFDPKRTLSLRANHFCPDVQSPGLKLLNVQDFGSLTRIPSRPLQTTSNISKNTPLLNAFWFAPELG